MGGKTILVLLLVVGGLFLVLRFTDRTVPVEVAQEASLLDGKSLGDAVRIRWEFDNRQPIELDRGPDGELMLAEPIRDRVAQGYLRQIVTAWDSARLRRTPLLDRDEDRAKAGLAPPVLKFTVWWADQPEPLRIEIGAESPLGNGRFVRRSGAIWEGGEGVLTSLQVGLEDLRDRAVFRAEAAVTKALRVTQRLETGKRETLRVERAGADWRVRDPIDARADGDAALAFVTAVLALRVDDFVLGMVRLPEREPELEVEVDSARGREAVRLWLDAGNVFGQLPDRDVVFVSDNRQYTQVFVNAVERLRARLLLPMRSVAQELGEVVLDRGGVGSRTRLERSSVAGDWRLAEPVGFATHPTPVNELLQALNNLHARQFVDDRPASDPALGLGADKLLLIVKKLDQQQVATIWLGNEVQVGEERLVYACRADEPTGVVLVPAMAVDVLRRAWTSYCALQVADVRTTVERLELQSRTGQRTAFVLGKAGWTKEGSDAVLDELGGLVDDQLRDLRGERAVDLGASDFGTPDWTLSLQRANGDTFVALEFWDRSKDAPLVVKPRNDVAIGFELSGFLAKNLRELWR
jgi:hypothetical protein